MKTSNVLIGLTVIGLTIGGGITGTNKVFTYLDNSQELAVYQKLHSPKVGAYYEVEDISTSTTGGKQFVTASMIQPVVSTTKNGETIIVFTKVEKSRMIEVPVKYTGPRSIGSILVIEESAGQQTSKYFINGHEATKNILGIKNEKSL